MKAGSQSRVRFLLRFVSPHKGRLFVVFLLSLVSTTLGLSYPLLARFFIDEVLAKRNSRLLVLTTLAVVLLALLSFLLGAVTRYLSTSASARILMGMRLHLFRHLQSLSLRFHNSTKTGEILSRLNSDMAEIQTIATDAVLSFALSFLTLAGTTGLLLWLNWKLFLLSSLFVPLSLKSLRHYRPRLAKQAKDVRERNADVGSTLVESLGGMKFIKSLGAEEAEARKLARQNERFIDSLLSYQVVAGLAQTVPALFLSLSAMVVLFCGGHLVVKGLMTIGTLVAFAAYQGRVLGPMQNMMGLYLSLQRARVSLDRVFEFLEVEPEVKESSRAIELPAARGEIEFRHVSFSYEPGQRVANDVSFRVPGGGRVAIVGQSGAGKSTLVDLLLRFYDPEEGSVLLDGHDLRDLRFKTLRDHIAVITHDPYVFHATVEENIRYAKWEASFADIEAAMKAADLDDFVRSLPEGYQTVVGERGAKFSSGQRQRLAIARAVLKGARVWIFDEAAATLDVLTESRIRRSLMARSADSTVLIVTHRLASVRDADQILVLDRGEVIDAGTHECLMQKNGLYRRLVLAAQPEAAALKIESLVP